MPRTTVSVQFNGKNNGLLDLFNRLEQASTKLDGNLKKLQVTLDGVDKTLARISSRGNVFSGVKMPSSGGLASAMGGNNALSGGLAGIGGAFVGTLRNTASIAKSVFSVVTSTVTSSVTGAYTKVKDFLTYTNSAVTTLGNAIRQIGQGIQAFGLSLSIFVSAPLAKMLQGVVSEAVNFDDAMNSVQKVTGGTNDQIFQLGEALTQSSLMLTDSRADLAKYAEDWGALGVTISSTADAAMMSGLVEWTSKLVMSAEDLTAGDVVEKLGKAIILYFPDIREFDKIKDGIGSVILALEDANSIGASDILSTFQRMAPIAQQMGIDMVSALSMSASAAAGIASAERAGTELAAALQKVSINTEKAAKATGMQESAIIDMINTDAEGYILSLAFSISQMTDKVEQQNVLYEQFGVTGGKAIAALVSSWENVEKNINVSNQAFAEGIYLQAQYTQSLESTKVQLKILGNNFTYLGSTIGDALLPTITKIVTVLVPAIQMLATWFKSLDEGIKLQIVGWMIFGAVIGPVILFLSSFIFMLGLLISGFSSIFSVIGMVAQGFISFGATILGLLSPLSLLGMAIAGIAVYAFYLAQDLVNAESIVGSYVSRMYEWGYNLISSFSDGILSAASMVYNAVYSVISSFIGLLQAFSPPKEGPLRNISVWGENVMLAFGEGMKAAAEPIGKIVEGLNLKIKGILESLSGENVSMFSSMFGAIKSAISAVAETLGVDAETIENRTEAAAVAIAEFIKNLQSGIPDDLRELGDWLGGLGGDYENLIRLQFDYAAGETRLNAIENALKGIGSETDRLISQVVTQNDLTADQQSAMIRRIKLEQAARKSGLEAEKEQIAAQQEQLKKDIDKKKEILDILIGLLGLHKPSQTQPDREAIDRPEKPPKEPKPDDTTPLDFEKFKEGAGVLGQVAEKFDKVGESTKSFTEKLGAAKTTLTGFIAAIRGDSKEDWGEQPAEFWTGWTKGSEIRTTVLKFLTDFDTAISNLKSKKDELWESAQLSFLMGFDSGKKGGKLNWEAISYLGVFAATLLVVGYVAGSIYQSVKDTFDYIFGDSDGKSTTPTTFETVMTRLKEAYDGFKKGWNETTTGIDWDAVTESIGTIGVAIAAILTDKTLWEAIGGTLGLVVKLLANTIILLGSTLGLVASIFGAKDTKKSIDDTTAAIIALGGSEETAHRQSVLLHGIGVLLKSGWDSQILSLQNMVAWLQRLGNEKSPDSFAKTLKGWSDSAAATLTGWSDTIEHWYKYNKWSPKNMWLTMMGQEIEKETIDGEPQVKTSGEPQVTKDGKKGGPLAESGKGAAKEYRDGFVTGFSSEESIVAIKAGINKGINDANVANKTESKGHGKYTATDVMQGMYDWFIDPNPTKVVWGAIKAAMDVWRLTFGKTELMVNGNILGTDVTTGINETTSTDTSYMDSLIGAIIQWIKDSIEIIKERGKNFGNLIIDGMVSIFANAGTALWEALKGTLDWLETKLPKWFRQLVGLDDPVIPDDAAAAAAAAVDTETTGRSRLTAFNATPTTSGAGNVVININIDNGGGKMDKANIDYLVDRIYGRLVKDMRLAGI